MQVIPVAHFKGRNLVAVPLTAWHKTLAKRLFPKDGFLKPTAIEVLVVDFDDMDTIVDGLKMRLWVCFLSDELCDVVDMSLIEFVSDCFFEVNGEPGYLPFAQSLMEVASEHYDFFSACEEGMREEEAHMEMPNGKPGSEDMASRMQRIELMMADLHENMVQKWSKVKLRGCSRRRCVLSSSESFL